MFVNVTTSVTTPSMDQGVHDNVTSWTGILSVPTHGSMEISTTELQPYHGYTRCLTFNFVFYTILTGLLCVLGMMGNTVSVLVLQKDNTNLVARFLLQSLAMADQIVLLTSFVVLVIAYGLMPYLDHQSDFVLRHRAYLIKYVEPFGYLAQTLTIWMTVLLAINRYIAICRPFSAVKHCTLRKAQLQVMAVVAFSVFFNLPRFFQRRVEFRTAAQGNPQVGDSPTGLGNPSLGDSPTQTTTSAPSITRVVLSPTAIGENSIFGIVYTNALYTILVLILPLVLLVVFNTSIIREMRVLRRRQDSLPPQLRDTQRAEKGITLVMAIIIFVFIVCHTPDRILQILLNFYPPLCGTVMFYAFNMCNLLIIFNSSCNFLIYYVFRRRFRRILISKLRGWFPGCCCCVRRREDNGSLCMNGSTRNSTSLINNMAMMEKKEDQLLNNIDIPC